MADNERLELLVAGQLYAGWKDAGITMAMDAASGTFVLAVSDRWAPNSQPWEINTQDTCEVRLGGETVISGYVDIVKSSFSGDDHGIEIQGRDKSADLVDCSAIHSPDEWRNITLTKFAQIVCQPFSIPVTAEVDVGPAIDLIKIQQGETALEAINRYAKMRKVLVMPDGKGGILLTRTGTKRAAVELVQGRNIKSASGTLDASERFSDYTVKGQAQFSDDSDVETETHVKAAVKDSGVLRYRPLLVIADTETNGTTAKERATWEANVRIGRSARAAVTVTGWRQRAGGELWKPNLLVKVKAPWMRLEGEMLIRQVTFGKGSQQGTTTQLDLVSPQSFEPEPPDGKQKKKAKKGKKGKENPWMSALGADGGGDEDDE